MPYTTTHVLVAIIAIELFREYFFKNNKKFPRYYILIAAIAGVFPDIEYLIRLSYHERFFLHSLFVPLIFALLGLFALRLKINSKYLGKKHMNLSFVLFIFAAGSLIHLGLDAIFVETLMPFYPISEYAIGFELVSKIKSNYQELVLPIVDALLLFFWIMWMQFKLKIDDYF